MAQPTIAELTAAAAATDEPSLVAPGGKNFGGVDPLGLRQINFDLMDEVLPGLNNVARHVRPFVVVAWAWRRALQRAQALHIEVIKQSEMQDFVDRIEVLYVLSQILRDKDADLPGRQYLAPCLKDPEFRFGDAKWKKRREERKYSTALSAPINYGPGLKMLKWVLPHPEYSGVMIANPATQPALDALEKELAPALDHEAFNAFGAVTVSRDDAKDWGELWALDETTEPETRVMRELLLGESAPLARRLGGRLMLAAAASERTADTARVRAAMAGPPSTFTPPAELATIRDAWRRMQMRQLFRLSLEALFYWTTLNLEGPPRSIDALVADLLAQVPPYGDSNPGGWIASLAQRAAGHTEIMADIQSALEEENRADLPRSIAIGVAFSLTEIVPGESHDEQPSRLPIAHARKQAQARANNTVPEFMRHVLESWVLAQHGYWSVGRGLADARARGRTLLRLRIILDEGGWTLTPGAPPGNPPQPTADRLHTALTLAAECGLLDAVVT
jgi:hypothetical protein